MTGNGTAQAPFETFQRAVRQVPHFPDPGARFVVDITGIGVESLPDNYVLPYVQFPTIDYPNDTSIPYFYSGAGLTIRALLQLVPLVPASDAVVTAATITADPDTNLITLKVGAPRASWTPANLVNKHVVRTGPDTHKAASVIVDVLTNDTLVLTNNASDFNGGTGALNPALGEVQIVEPSATLDGGVASPIDYNNDPSFSAFAGIISTVNSIAFQGISFTNRAGFTALGVCNCPNTPLEVCDVAGFIGQGQAGTYWVFANGCVMSYGLISVNASFFSSACHFFTDPALGFPFFFYIANATPQSFSNAVFTNCDTYRPGQQGALPIIANTAFQNVQMNCDGVTGGILVNSGRLALDHVQINDAGGNAVEIRDESFGTFAHVTGSGNAGQGALVTDGSQLRVDDQTTIGNADGRAYTNGTLPGVPNVVPVWPGVPFNDTNLTTLSRVFEP